MSDAESPILTNASHVVSIDEIRALTGAATPHFALQVRERVKRLIAQLPADSAVRAFGQGEVDRLLEVGRRGETRGTPNEPTLAPLASVDPEA
ncbi:MAG: hypothetical protein F2799_06100 [Actinobacteria bacterium]|uniref:Unannotated protein n=1 Tax=freshwater metagenome TaxID=449393 RepID=A0A6J7EH76_9ZZZZ|nr:hypothetical protein [Actinomycetota bacterium]